ncbi:MAG: S-methyl-5'-thioadenosine phosphorylase [Thermococci archaeon]|nr:S-methyl-5'-thioadenosine phosphorylase [Thermococci archaeon]
MPRVAIIGGSGLEELLEEIHETNVETPYGQVSLRIGTYGGEEIAFLSRHGPSHAVPPHRVNYRANIWGLWKLGVERIIGTSAVGSLNLSMKPGDFVVLDQLIDFTKSRRYTFYDGEDSPHDMKAVTHVDFTEPYCPEIRKAIIDSAKELRLPYHPQGTYACTEGPRFETRAEIRALKILGADVVGMTQCPEAALARELGMCYASVAVVTNYAAGISGRKLTHTEVIELMKEKGRELRALLMRSVTNIPKIRRCECGKALEGATAETEKETEKGHDEE